MLWQTLAPVFAGALLLVTSCDSPEPISPTSETPAFAGVPASGNDNKFVVVFDENFSLDCDGEQLAVDFTGWLQGRIFPQASNPNIELDVFHSLFTFTNTAGETFTFRDVGPNHAKIDFDTGVVTVELSGRISGGVIGHLVFNTSTGEVDFIAGNVELAARDALACEALT